MTDNLPAVPQPRLRSTGRFALGLALGVALVACWRAWT